MKELFFGLCILVCTSNGIYCQTTVAPGELKVVIIRHAEKPIKGDNLNCQGLNRSLQLPAVLYSKFGIPDFTYVPSIGLDRNTRHSRMFQTIIPFAVKYDLTINSKFTEKDSAGIASDIRAQKGLVLVIWEHRAIPSLVRALGVPDFQLVWDDNDYDSIWIVEIRKDKTSFTKTKEGLFPSPACSY